MPRVFEVTTDPAWVEPIVAAATSLALASRCNQGAVSAGRLDLSVPSAEQLWAFMHSPDHDLIVAHDGPSLDGYLAVAIVEEGCLGRWVGVFRLGTQAVLVYRGLLDVAVDLYGAISGRITNDELRLWLADRMPGTIDPDDPQIVHYPGG